MQYLLRSENSKGSFLKIGNHARKRGKKTWECLGGTIHLVWQDCVEAVLETVKGVYVYGSTVATYSAFFEMLRCYDTTKMFVVVVASGGFCSTMQCLILTWATARACLTWWPRCSLRSRMKATPSGALSASWRTPSSSAPRGTKTWRGSW